MERKGYKGSPESMGRKVRKDCLGCPVPPEPLDRKESQGRRDLPGLRGGSLLE
jgi:hypothetical protein